MNTPPVFCHRSSPGVTGDKIELYEGEVVTYLDGNDERYLVQLLSERLWHPDWSRSGYKVRNFLTEEEFYAESERIVDWNGRIPKGEQTPDRADLPGW